MVLPIWALAIVLFGHWLADFVWQPDWMARAKSSSWLTLAAHAGRIAVGAFAIGTLVQLVHGHHLIWPVWIFAGINGASHFVIDAITSRMTGRYFKQSRTHEFFVTIGLDQYLHVMIAAAAAAWLFF